MAKRGRPRTDPFKDFTISPGPGEDMYTVRYKLRGKNCVLVVKRRKEWESRPFHGRKRGKNKVIISTPHKTFLRIARLADHKGWSINAVAKMLEKKFGQELKRQKFLLIPEG